MREKHAGENNPAQKLEHFAQQAIARIRLAEMRPGIRLGCQPAKHLDRPSVSTEWVDRLRKSAPMNPQLENKVHCLRFGRSLLRPDGPVGLGDDLGQMMGEPALQYGAAVL